MQARLSAVQRALIVLLVASLAVAVFARPAPANGRLRRALAELEQFNAQFHRGNVEQSLLEYARAQGRKPLAELAAAVSGPGVPSVAATEATVEPLASLQVATLADVRKFAKPASTLPLANTDLAQLGPRLAWRLARSAQPEQPVTLKSVELRPAQLTQADLELEVEVAKLRLEQLSAAATTNDAAKQLEAAEALLEQRKKWKLPWKVIAKTMEARKEKKTELDTQRRNLKAIEGRYEAAVKRAESKHEALPFPPFPEFGVAPVELEQAAQARAHDLPMQLNVQAVTLPSLGGGDFREVQAAGLWPEVQGSTASDAIQKVRAHFNWHYRYVELGGLKIGGMTLLQFLPCGLPLFLWLLLRRMREVASTYNPFDTRVTSALPKVGFGPRALDALVLVALPLMAAGCATTALLLVGQVPALPVLVSVIDLLLGGYAFIKLGELQNLMLDVVRSHSNPPEQG
mgnify:CR=1 FL=1